MSVDTNTLTVKIYRYSPNEEQEARYDVFQLPRGENQSVLQVLQAIYEEQDSTLAFYHSCRIGKCTGCHLKVNGKVRLACTEIVKGNDLLIEPMPGYDVVRDLVVNRTQAHLTAKKGDKEKRM